MDKNTTNNTGPKITKNGNRRLKLNRKLEAELGGNNMVRYIQAL